VKTHCLVVPEQPEFELRRQYRSSKPRVAVRDDRRDLDPKIVERPQLWIVAQHRRPTSAQRLWRTVMRQASLLGSAVRAGGSRSQSRSFRFASCSPVHGRIEPRSPAGVRGSGGHHPTVLQLDSDQHTRSHEWGNRHAKPKKRAPALGKGPPRPPPLRRSSAASRWQCAIPEARRPALIDWPSAGQHLSPRQSRQPSTPRPVA